MRACTMESHSRMLARNWLPRPSPLLAPFTRPAMSTNSTEVGTTDFDFEMPLSTCSSHGVTADCAPRTQYLLLQALRLIRGTGRQAGKRQTAGVRQVSAPRSQAVKEALAVTL